MASFLLTVAYHSTESGVTIWTHMEKRGFIVFNLKPFTQPTSWKNEYENYDPQWIGNNAFPQIAGAIIYALRPCLSLMLAVQ